MHASTWVLMTMFEMKVSLYLFRSFEISYRTGATEGEAEAEFRLIYADAEGFGKVEKMKM